jgi:hypothetical protein
MGPPVTTSNNSSQHHETVPHQPKVSVYAQRYGHYDFNQAPMAPPGTYIIAHEKPKQRASWDPHGVYGWYIGPTTDHYRCYRVHINKTKADKIVDTLELFPVKVAMPRTASKDMATISDQELTHALLHPEPPAPFSTIGGAQLQALRQLATIFDTALPRASTVTSEHVPSNGTNISLSPGCRSLSHAPPVPPSTPTAFHNALFPTHAPPRMGPSQSQSLRVCPRLVSYSRVVPSRSPSPRSSPRQAPPAVPTTPHHLRHQLPSPRAHDTPTHRASPHAQGNTGTNICADAGNVVEEEEEEVPPQHRNHSQTARHSAHAVYSMPMANAVIQPTTSAKMEYRGLISDHETFPILDRAYTNEFGRLAQGVGGRIEGSNIILFIPRSAVPRKKTVTNG